MNKKLIALGITTLVLGGLVVTPKLAEAYQGDPSITGSECTEERHTQIEQAFENNDYYGWKELMNGKGKVTQVITEKNFTRFAEAHKLAEEGKLDEANVIKQELGLGLGNRGGYGNGLGQVNGRGLGRGLSS